MQPKVGRGFIDSKTESATIWPADQVERRAVATLLPYAKNARTHSPAQIAQIAASITEWGFTMPVLVDAKGVLIAGHGRLAAAQSLGLAEVPTMVATNWTKAQIQAYRIADNKLALNAGWDDATLVLELTELKLDGFDLSITGFSGDELAGLLDTTEGLTDPDAVPEAPAVPVTVEGDVWRLGRHRLMCGDSTRDLDVSLALAGVRPHLMVTDPPYGVSYDASWRRTAGLNGAGTAVGKVSNDGQADWSAAWALFPGGVAYVWHGGLHGAEVADSLAASKFKLRAQIVWVKTRPVISRGDYHWQHEPLLHVVKEGEEDHWRFIPEHEIVDYSVRAGSTGHWEGSRKQSTVWFIEHLKSETGHSTQKPVECMKRPIINNSGPGEAVYEPFSGSGTTIIAAEMTGRACYAIEISPTYCDVAVLRWQAFTGQTATLESTGQPFPNSVTIKANE